MNKNNLLEMPLISIIVPVYKVEKYLKRCIDSICAQTYQNIEIILVDDGSPDNCGLICDEYARKDDRVVVIHKENGGLSDARNAGIDRAKGDFIGFVDSDDYIQKDMYEYLIGLIVDYDADIATCTVCECYEGQLPVLQKSTFIRVVNRVDVMRMALESQITMFVVDKLYSKKLFESVKFKQGKIYEDAFVSIDLLEQVKKAVISDEQKYYYTKRSDSISNCLFNENTHDIVEAHDYNYYKVTQIEPSLEKAAMVRRCWARFVVLDKMILSKEPLSSQKGTEYIRFLREHRKEIMQSKMLSKGRKLSFLVLLVSPFLYSKVVWSKQ